MINEIKRDMKLHGETVVVKAAIPLLGMMLGMVLMILIGKLDGELPHVCMGTLIALGLNILMTMIWGIAMPQEFMLALSMGGTRKEFLTGCAFRSLLGQLLAYLILVLCYLVELAVYPVLLPGFVNALPMGRLLGNGWFLLGMVPGLTLVQMFCGVLYGRFGKPFGTVLYLVWMGCCLLAPRFFHEESMAGRMFAAVTAWGSRFPAIWLVLLAVAVAAMAATVIGLGRKQMVK